MADDTLIDHPGVYDIPADRYHSDPVKGGSLSNSGAKKLLTPGCPAIFKAWIDGQADEEPKPHFDFGRAVHREVLGAGDDVEVIPFEEWRTAEAKALVKAARDAGRTPIRPSQAQRIADMAGAVRDHPVAAALLAPDSGKPEQTLVMRDPATGVWCRALVDHLRHPEPQGRLMLVDYKSAAEVDPDSCAKAIGQFGYYKQGAWYTECAEALDLSRDEPAFLFVFQRKEPPYLVSVVQLAPEDLARGREAAAGAREIYAWCRRTGRWPGYADDHVMPDIHMPVWAQMQHDAASTLGAFRAPEEIPA